MASSRLDRLVTLLETGSTQLIRNTAAQQLADVQKQHPDELFNLLTRVIPYLRSKSWDTRIAAAKAVGGIVENAEKFDPNAEDPPSIKSENGDGGATFDGSAAVKSEVKTEDGVAVPPNEEQFTLETLDVALILKQGKKLLGSVGKEYDYMLANLDPAERLAHQKKSLTARLGLGGEYIEEDLVTEKDFALPTPKHSNPMPTPGLHKLDTSISRTNSAPTAAAESATSPHEQPAQTPADENGGLSKRQLNMLKRKNKKEFKNQATKVRVIDLAGRRSSVASGGSSDQLPAPQSAQPQPHAIKQESGGEGNDVQDYFSLDRPNGDDDAKVVSEFKGVPPPEKSTFQSEEEESGLEWPYERLCDYLSVELFDPHWEVRHGAAMGLREVVRVHGAGAGRIKGRSRAENDVLNKRWLEDLACRLCCVFMLDRFGDYISDNVVAPIRETAGQTLGVVLQHMPAESVKAVYHILYRLVMQLDLGDAKPAWQACHGGMIGLRYLVAVRSDLLLHDRVLMDGVLNAVMKGLSDYDDDVRAMSAATLIPVAREFVNLRPSALNSLIHIVWDCLSSLSDDLSASTGSVMDLLAKLCSFPEVLDAMKKNAAMDQEQSFANLVPRLFYFLRHTITSVRSAVLRALLTFLDIEGEGTKGWINGKALRLIYQNVLVERNEAVAKLSLKVYSTLLTTLSTGGPNAVAVELGPHIDALVQLTVHPIGVSRHPIPMDGSLFIKPSGQTYALPAQPGRKASSPTHTTVSEKSGRGRRKSDKKEKEAVQTPTTHNVDAHMMQGDVDLVGMDVMLRSKMLTAEALGKTIASWPSPHRMETFGVRLVHYMKSPYSTTQLTASMVAEEYAKATSDKDDTAVVFAQTLHRLVEDERPAYYSDLTSYLQVVRAQCQSLLSTFRETAHVAPSKLPTPAVIVQGEPEASQFAFGMADATKIVEVTYEQLKKQLTPAQRIASSKPLADARTDVITAMEEAITVKDQRDVRIRAAAAAAIVALRDIPKKPALTIKGLMDSVKKEENEELQKRSAAAVAVLVDHLSAAGKHAVIDKVVGNLVKFCCMETAETPEFHPNAHMTIGILSLKKEEDVRDPADAARFEAEIKAARITRRGAKEALEQLVVGFGSDVFGRVPILRRLIEAPIQRTFAAELPADIADPNTTLGQEAVDGMSTLRALVAKFDPGLHDFVLELLPLVAKGLQSKLAVLRYAAAKCFATVCSVLTVQGITMLVEQVLPAINNANDVHCRQGAIECVYHLIHVMEDGILPYVIFLIVPVLGRMSDSDNDVRLIATTTFATLVKLVPLEAGIPDPPGLSEELLKGRDRERKFMSQMLDAKKVEPFEIPVAIKAELRSYQQEGVNWLAFLNRYHLHGILCDDMGLGKTLQTLCIVASDHHMRAEEFARTHSPDVRRLPSLIVCPPTLSGHWQQEIRQYAPFITAVAYVGAPAERVKYRPQLTQADIVITSYDICRNDIDFLAPLNWNYCVLDEGHLIKNPKAKTTLAVKRLASNHRLILSGTPIQNNVLELWSLFDFLMPGFLGTEKVFHDRFSKPIAASRFAKSSSKDQEAGALAIEALHKQVLPFLLRRLKEEVLNDLPPKIIQNYYCDLSDLQKRLFESFSKKEGKSIAEKATSANDRESKQHIFQALQYMRKLCNSPAFVVKPEHRDYGDVQQYLGARGSSLQSAEHAPKLGALRDLLIDCGIGTADVGANGGGNGNNGSGSSGEVDIPSAGEAVSQHRALIFCQMKEMLDMVQNQVLQRMLPSVQYMRLDGSVEATRRQEIVNQFNSDPSYDVLLLTTSVGGLGLNLTGADTVIFVEHDWNPQKDMQAMDRAHRIGQRKVVNVYRIVTRGTLEEKILNLQRFKIDVASTVVNQQNAGLGTMETDQILDLFNFSADEAATGGLVAPPPGAQQQGGEQKISEDDAVDATGAVREAGKRGFLDELGDLWDERQYEEEYNLDSFLASMKG
ncbi:SNF2 family DNA-dependent ATPase domain-containing protein [Lineolata rhizophorae]|uniref:TATA-binding protein-associated factor mot1 n=1 Tax=Lineolata rhizophorae TaxID=578093 RepID=A0A6A6NWI0_9PEZI|nr:SNF2 family DNA-dependent ATPase domain-containing protein [Lineolata rhizophorae]